MTSARFLPHDAAPIARLIARCLERDPKRRLRDIGEARVALDDAIAHPAAVGELPRATSRSATASRLWRVMPWIVAGAAVAAAGYLAVRPGATLTRESLELDISPPSDGRFLINSNSGNVQLSPDGTKVPFRAAAAGRDALWIRSLGRDDARPLAGTEGAQYPFWRPTAGGSRSSPAANSDARHRRRLRR